MAATTLTALPSAIYAGDTLLLSLSIPNFPAGEGWTLTFQFGSEITFASTASGNDYSFTIPATTTATWAGGLYQGIGYVSGVSSQRHTVWRGRMEILPGASNTQNASDLLPWYFAARDSMRLVIAGKAGRDVLNSTIAGQNVERLTPEQAIELLDYLEALCNAFLENQDADNGDTGGRLVKIRFNHP